MLVWDHLVTISEEVELIWPAKWTAPKTLFLLNRYVGTSLYLPLNRRFV